MMTIADVGVVVAGDAAEASGIAELRRVAFVMAMMLIVMMVSFVEVKEKEEGEEEDLFFVGLFVLFVVWMFEMRIFQICFEEGGGTGGILSSFLEQVCSPFVFALPTTRKRWYRVEEG